MDQRRRSPSAPGHHMQSCPRPSSKVNAFQEALEIGGLVLGISADGGVIVGERPIALELAPRNFHALIARGDAFSQLGEFGPALADLDQALKLAPSHPHALVVRGVIHARQGDPQLALQDYDAALKLSEHEPFALMSRAALYAADGKYGPAIRDLDASLTINDKNALAFYNRGYAHFSLADYAAAVRHARLPLRVRRVGLVMSAGCLVYPSSSRFRTGSGFRICVSRRCCMFVKMKQVI